MALLEQPANQKSNAASSSAAPLLPDALTLQSRQDAEAYGKKLFEQGGADLVQKMLKEAIAKSKALDQDVLREKKKADTAQKEAEEVARELTKKEGQKKELHLSCMKTLKNNQDIENLLEKLKQQQEESKKKAIEEADAENQQQNEEGMIVEDEHLRKVRNNFIRETTSIREKSQKQLQEALEKEQENEKLAAEFEAKKKEFDDRIQERIANWKENETQSTQKLTEVQLKLQHHVLLQSKVSREEENHEELLKNIAEFEAAITNHTKRNEEFRHLINQSNEALSLYNKNAEIRTKNVAQLEEQKKRIVADELEARSKSHKIKTVVLKELRRRIANLEKDKQQLEKKSRELLAAKK